MRANHYGPDNGLGEFLNDFVGPTTYREARQDYGQTLDHGLLWPYDGAMHTTLAIRRALQGVGFHGHLIHGCHLAVCPAGQSAALDAMVADTAGTRWKPVSPSGGAPYTYGDSAFWNQRRPEGFVLLRPGETIDFGRAYREGVYLALCTAETQPARSTASATGHTSRKPDPLVRLYAPGTPVPPGLGYVKTPYEARHEAVETDDPFASPLAYSQVVWVPDGTTHIVVTFWDDVAWASGPNLYDRVQAGESGSYEVWWGLPMGAANQWLHHEDDDFDAAGRGVVAPGHASEVYAVPEFAQTVYVRQVSGDDFYFSVHAVQSERR